MDTLERVEVAAHILYATYHRGGYSPQWASAPGKGKWREAAKALLNAVDAGTI